MEWLVVLMCYFHQPVAVYVQAPDGIYLSAYAKADLDADTQARLRALCAADREEGKRPKGLAVWHLDRLNGHFTAGT